MWPWSHAALGYLCYALYLRVRAHRRPGGWPVVALAVGTQFPDLVDKPLAWQFHVLPSGRTLAHSLVVVVPVSLLVIRAATRYDRRPVGVAFVVGYLSHPVADALLPLLLGEWSELGFLVWPLVESPPTEVVEFLPHLYGVAGSPFFLFGLALTAAAAALWNHHGRPGLRELLGVLSPTTALQDRIE